MADWRTRLLELGDEGDRFARGILGAGATPEN